jgi:hypothetical protein
MGTLPNKDTLMKSFRNGTGFKGGSQKEYLPNISVKKQAFYSAIAIVIRKRTVRL